MRQCYCLPRVTLVVPCYNEEKRLDTAAFRDFRLPDQQLEFLFVNDGSTDNTLQVIEKLPGRVLNLERNSGKAEAVRRGFLEALNSNPDLIGFWDADLATPLNELPGFLTVLTSRPEIEMVFGARVRLLGREISRNPS